MPFMYVPLFPAKHASMRRQLALAKWVFSDRLVYDWLEF